MTAPTPLPEPFYREKSSFGWPDLWSADQMREAIATARAQALKEAAQEVPTTWLDPMLTGPDAIGSPPFGGTQIEQLCRRIAGRIRSLAGAEGKKNG